MEMIDQIKNNLEKHVLILLLSGFLDREARDSSSSVQKIACPGEFHYNKLSFLEGITNLQTKFLFEKGRVLWQKKVKNMYAASAGKKSSLPNLESVHWSVATSPWNLKKIKKRDFIRRTDGFKKLRRYH
jgi:hypothetical protein